MTTSIKKFEREKNKLEKRLKRLVGKGISDFSMINDHDLVMVAISGGKDSYTLLDILVALKAYAPVRFDIIAVNLDQRQPGFPERVLPDYCRNRGISFQSVRQDTYSVVKRVIPEGKTTCSLCSRLRRGALYRKAKELGASKIALGHHRDDMLETFFLNLFHGGQIKSMPPKLVSDDKQHIVIRPLVYCIEKDIQAYADIKKFPIIPCNLCGSQPNLERKKIKEMLAAWEKESPGRNKTIFSSLRRLKPSHLLDKDAFNFSHLDQIREFSADAGNAINQQVI